MNFFRFFLPEIWLCAYGFGFSSSKSETKSENKTENKVTDQRVAASEGAVAAGAGASISIQSSDAAVVASTGDAIARVAESANDAVSESAQASVNATRKASETAVMENADVSKAALTAGQRNLETASDLSRDLGGKAIDSVRSQGRDALDFGERALQIATAAANRSQDTTNDLIQRTNEQFTATLARNAGDAPQTVTQDAIKYGALAIAAIVAAFVFLRPSKSAN